MTIKTIDQRIREQASRELKRQLLDAAGAFGKFWNECSTVPWIDQTAIPFTNGAVSVSDLMDLVKGAYFNALDERRGEDAVRKFVDQVQQFDAERAAMASDDRVLVGVPELDDRDQT